MSKFATTAPRSPKAPVPTTNLAGGSAYAQPDRLHLVSHFLTSLVEDKYYESKGAGVAKVRALIESLIKAGDAEFVAKAAVYARRTFNMRSISHLAAALLGGADPGAPWRRPFYRKVVVRADDPVEILAAFLALRGADAPIPNAMKRGLGAALSGFDGYQLAKYRGGSGKLKLIDAVNLLRPKSTDALTQLMTGVLPSADTWEAGLSAAGPDADAKAAVWRNLFAEDRLGYMAALRNIRNILAQAPDLTGVLCDLIRDPERVAKSKQFPYRFWSAMKANPGAPRQVVLALDEAMTHSCRNVPRLTGRTLVAADFSGSMSSRVSGKSDISCREIASLLGVVVARHNDADLIYFGDAARYARIHPTDSVMGQLAGLDKLNRRGGPDYVGLGTNVDAVFRLAQAERKGYDRVLLFSDMQSWRHTGEAFEWWCKATKSNPYVYSVDLAGHGSSVFNTGNPRLFQLAGWSDKVFDLIGLAETGLDALVSTVERVEF